MGDDQGAHPVSAGALKSPRMETGGKIKGILRERYEEHKGGSSCWRACCALISWWDEECMEVIQ
jgi:hypothetical protein